MTTINLNDYVAGGYLVTRYAEYPYWKADEEQLLPQYLLSISDCRGKTLDLYYEKSLTEFGVTLENIAAFKQWRHEKTGFDIAYPDIFRSPDTARFFMQHFLPGSEEVFLIGIGLHKTLVTDFLTTLKQEKSTFKKLESIADNWEINVTEPFGVDRILLENRSLAEGGRVLGFDIAAYSTLFVCSWICLHHEYELKDKLGTIANSYGLIDSFETANIVKTWREDTATYQPWLIVEYPIAFD